MRTKIQLSHTFDDIVSCENLLGAWEEFVIGKRYKPDVERFVLNLMDNIFQLHEDLIHRTYKHGGYQAFHIFDPKPRYIHKASVRDRLLHHVMYRKLYPFFDRTFIGDSYSCRINRGTHKALNRFRSFAYKTSYNNTKTCWILKCDIKKFFQNIDHGILKRVLSEYIPDQDILWLLGEVIDSFHVRGQERGLPLGNLTSQLFVNIYMNEFDQFVKHEIRARYYIRYADDFVLLSKDKYVLEAHIPIIKQYLEERLKLELHPDKLYIKTLTSGIDFLGWVHFPDHRVLRTTTKKRMMRKIEKNPGDESRQAYLGLLKHGNTWKLKQKLSNASLTRRIKKACSGTKPCRAAP